MGGFHQKVSDMVSSNQMSPLVTEGRHRQSVPVIDAHPAITMSIASVAKEGVMHPPGREPCPVHCHVCGKHKLKSESDPAHCESVDSRACSSDIVAAKFSRM